MSAGTASETQTSRDLEAIRAFYDRFTRKLVRDYIDGNVRQARAFELVRSMIGPDTKTILDVGCGIGASAASYVEGRRGVTVHGVDISPHNIQVATALFGGSALRFSVSDMEAPPCEERYDLIAMVDVHEHIPREKWDVLHDTLERSLSDTGTIVITTPSPLHQNYLRNRKPEALQVVDETIELSDITALAERLDASVIRYQWVGVWHANDYVHTVISRAPRFDPVPRRARWRSPIRPPAVVSRAEDLVRRIVARVDRGRRALHVRKTLGISIVTLLLAATEALRSAADHGHRTVPAWGQHAAPA